MPAPASAFRSLELTAPSLEVAFRGAAFLAQVARRRTVTILRSVEGLDEAYYVVEGRAAGSPLMYPLFVVSAPVRR